MDGLVFLLLVAGILAASLVAFGFWARRRSVRSARPAVADAQASAVALHGTADRLTAGEAAAAPAGETPGSAAGFRDAQGGHPDDRPLVNSATEGIFLGEAGAPVRSPEIVLPARQQQPVEEDLPHEPTRERSEADGPTAPPAPRPAAGGGPSGEQAEAQPPLGGCANAEAEDEGPADGQAANDPGHAPIEPPVSEAKPEADEPPMLPISSGSPVHDIADPVEALDARSADAIDNIPADPADAAQPDAIADSAVAGAVPLSPAEPKDPGDEGANGAAEPRDGPAQEETPETAATSGDDEQDSAGPEPALAESTSEEASDPSTRRSIQPAVHRDRRGSRRAAAPASTPAVVLPILLGPTARPPAEAKLRLSLHPIRRTARLSVVLARPDGFPQRVTLHVDGQSPIEAYNAQRYDDLDLPWTGELLEGELRVASAEGFQWLRSARYVHIFAEDPSEPDLISVGAARPGVAHTLICRSGDAAAVCAASASTGSPEPTDQERWQGIPDGWTVLSGYTPAHAADHPLAAGLRPLDPGAGIEIGFEGGLAVRLRVFAQGHPPRIAISPEPVGASVTIGGQPAALAADGGWEAPGWDVPGHHLVDVVPGPSAAYEIAADPSGGAGWEFWNAHAGRFGDRAAGPWARAEICGASIRGPAGQSVLAVETQPTLIALGARSGAVPLSRRADVSVSVGFVPELPAFLLSATGQRRSQGRVIWLGLTPPALSSRRPDPDWAAAVRAAASRRLPLQGADALGEDAWRKAKERARRLRRPRR